MPPPLRLPCAALLAVLATVAPGLAAEPLPFGAAGAAPAAPWQWIGLPHQSKPRTLFSVVDLDGHRALRVESDKAYGNLVHAVPAGSQHGHLAWQWRMERLNEAADLRTREGDDTSLKVCVLWDLPLDKLPFLDRQLLRVARAAAAQPLPAATVCYVWDAHLSEGTVLASAYPRRLRYLVLRSGNAALNTWTAERRDIGADFLQLFGDESRQLPPLLALGVGADTDNTRAHSVGYVADLAWSP